MPRRRHADDRAPPTSTAAACRAAAATSCRRRAATSCSAVSDTGIGMDDARARAAVRAVLHHQGAGPGHRPRAGHGLRHRAAERRAHPGRSRGRGEGSTLHVYLPRAAAPATRRGVRPRAPGSGGSETVLVAEDEEAVRHLVCRVLRAKGYRVLEAPRRAKPRSRWRRAARADRPAGDRPGHAGNGRRALATGSSPRGPGSACSSSPGTPPRRSSARAGCPPGAACSRSRSPPTSSRTRCGRRSPRRLRLAPSLRRRYLPAP